ncbi:Cof-type HAD-IIB family hydrolase [Paenibacillus doosanensis]|uniref:HAD family hydrolase n=1 Tax=Paenibacillus doosanensis TaxID=1229154 RepID=UPI00217FAC0E|nr:HAD family hydrolase [Paenibacillus doosanensis]MCS7461396.1 Cof-type HAD-IIB family hydrolase [Paenibacillus doosanensis]
MNNIRLIVSDLDGTLLSEDHSLTEPVKEAVRRFRANGGMFTIATGRFGLAAQKIVEELDIDIPFILCNGSVIADRSRVWSASTLELRELTPFLLAAERSGVTVMLFEEAGVSVLSRTAAVEQFEIKEGIRCVVVDPSEEGWQGKPLQKILLIGDMRRIRELWELHLPSFNRSYATIQSEDDYFEVIPPNQSKGSALKKLAELLQVTPAEVLGIGNQLNDMDMIEYAGVGAAVANSHPELKAKASFVCSRCYGDGVVEAMEALGLLSPVSETEEDIR